MAELVSGNTSVAVPRDMEEHSARKVREECLWSNLFISEARSCFIHTGVIIKRTLMGGLHERDYKDIMYRK